MKLEHRRLSMNELRTPHTECPSQMVSNHRHNIVFYRLVCSIGGGLVLAFDIEQYLMEMSGLQCYDCNVLGGSI